LPVKKGAGPNKAGKRTADLTQKTRKGRKRSQEKRGANFGNQKKNAKKILDPVTGEKGFGGGSRGRRTHHQRDKGEKGKLESLISSKNDWGCRRNSGSISG